MKKIISVILSVLLISSLLCTIPSASGSDTIKLTENGSALYTIVYSQSAPETEKTAAQTLEKYLEQICGADFTVTTDSSEEREHEILVGHTSRSESAEALNGKDFGEDGVRIATLGKKIVLTGGVKRGALYALYTLLEDYFGCRWFTSELTVVPENRNPTLPANLNYSYVPCFRLRQTYWRFSTANAEFCVAHKLDSCHTSVPESMGGTNPQYNVSGVHTLSSIVPAELFGEHPEYFGEDGSGIRSTDIQPCLSNPEVLSRGIAWAKEFFATHPQNKVLSISLIDCKNPCKCPECKAFDDVHGGVDSASLLNYVNKVAKAIAPEYPDCYIETLAYQYAQTPPENMTVEENVVIRLCNIGTCVLHDIDDPNCPDNVAYCENMEHWSSMSKNIYIWNYSTDFDGFYKLHPNFSTLQQRFQYFRDNNCVAVFDQGIGEKIEPAELHELRTYLSAKLLWNPDTDIQTHIREFCAAYYGDAAEDIVKFIGLFEEYVRGRNMYTFTECHLGCYGGGLSSLNGTSLTCCNVKELDKLMNCITAHEMTEEQSHRTKGFELSWQYFKRVTNAGEFNWFSPIADPLEASRQMYNDFESYGVKYLAESGNIPVGSEYSPNFATYPNYWFADMSERAPVFRFQAIFYPIINKVLHITLQAIIHLFK